MKKYFLRTVKGMWELVTEYVYSVRKFVVDPETRKPKYSGETIVQDGATLHINGAIQSDELGKLCRFLQVSFPNGTYSPIVTEPDAVEIIRGNMVRMHVLKTGENWSKSPASKPKAQQEHAA